MLDVAVQLADIRTECISVAYFVSISAPVATSVIISRIQGGGVIGRRSWKLLDPDHDYNNMATNLISKPTHPRSFRLLHDLKSVIHQFHSAIWLNRSPSEWNATHPPRSNDETRRTYVYLLPNSIIL